MHEMPYTQAIINKTLEKAKGQRVSSIYLVNGALSAIVPDSIRMYFEYLSGGTLVEGAKLYFRTESPTLVCKKCKKRIIIREIQSKLRKKLSSILKKKCSCGDRNFELKTGMSLRIDRIITL